MMHQEIASLKKQVVRLQLGLIACIALLSLFFVFSFTTDKHNFNIIRAKGLIIEDSAGKDRILIGAPIPGSAGRVRTDTSLVRKHWSKKYKDPEAFMKWYQDYTHSVNGMIVMNEEGFDRVIIGDKLPDPNTGKKIYESAGILFNDGKGWERGGAGVNTSKDGQVRAAFGLDDPDGEAVHLVTLEDGTKGLIIGGENGRLVIGMSNKKSDWFQNKEAFTGIRYFDLEGKLLWEQVMKKK